MRSSASTVGCVVSKIEDFRRVLLDSKATRKEKQIALKFLVHFSRTCISRFMSAINGDREATTYSSVGLMSARTSTGCSIARSSTATARMRRNGRRN